MAGVYAALVSLLNTITMEQTPRPSHIQMPFHGGLIDALEEKVRFLVEFLEQGWKGDQHLLGRIVDLAYAAEDAIESPIVDQILAGSTSSYSEKGSALLGQDHDLERIIQDLDSIKVEVMKIIQDNSGMKKLHPFSSEEKMEIMEELMGHQSCRRVIPIVGTDGIGNTALAQNIFDDKFITQQFDIRIWIPVSQEYNVKEILIEVLSRLEQQGNDQMDEETLGENIHKSFLGRKYLIILDDVCSIDVWKRIERFFPNNDNGSRIMVTTKFSDLARQLSNNNLEMEYLDDNNSWHLLCEKVFDQGNCPLELEEVGKKIAHNCRGLPLAIGVIGGLLATSKTLEYWKSIAEDLSSSIYLSDEEQCSKILALSYNHLPIHLKPCFLYMGIFPVDDNIYVSELYKLWIAEGFLKPVRGKTFEEIAEENLNDLIGRDLVTVSVSGWDLVKITYCEIHNLVRKLCLKEAQKEKFLCVVMADCLGDPISLNYHRRILIRLDNESVTKDYPDIVDSLQSASHVRSLIVDHEKEFLRALSSPGFKLLRVLYVTFGFPGLMDASKGYLGEVIPNLVNLRYLDFETFHSGNFVFQIGLFRNLQMLVDKNNYFADAGCEIWNLPHLRHVEFGELTLSEPPSREPEHDFTILENMQTLIAVRDFRFDEAILKRFPNVKRLRVSYSWGWEGEEEDDWSYYSAQNIGSLQKLESFDCAFYCCEPRSDKFLKSLASTHSLKKLSLYGCQLPWEGMTVIGSLPNLEVLILEFLSFRGSEWNPIEGEFRRLRSLKMKLITDLIKWHADSTHFPCLEQLLLIGMGTVNKKLEIPLGFGEIATLELILSELCSVSIVMSAKDIVEKQQSLGNHGLLIQVSCSWKIRQLDGFENKNFLFESIYDEYGDNDASDEASDDQEEESDNQTEYDD